MGRGWLRTLESAGVEVVVEVHEQEQHVIEFMAGHAPEAIESIEEFAKWMRGN